jgi:hypothetical protein
MSLRRLAIVFVLVLENKEGARFAAWPVCAVGREVLGAASGERRGAREQRREVIGAWCVQAARRGGLIRESSTHKRMYVWWRPGEGGGGVCV